mmetsp:Transcript_12428/g.35550  ORF Transcript_12428/g.35550 Transcript_12428/m.35550 type:complete len:226 (+) Transcript_12428:782-1459(+)
MASLREPLRSNLLAKVSGVFCCESTFVRSPPAQSKACMASRSFARTAACKGYVKLRETTATPVFFGSFTPRKPWVARKHRSFCTRVARSMRLVKGASASSSGPSPEPVSLLRCSFPISELALVSAQEVYASVVVGDVWQPPTVEPASLASCQSAPIGEVSTADGDGVGRSTIVTSSLVLIAGSWKKTRSPTGPAWPFGLRRPCIALKASSVESLPPMEPDWQTSP